MSATGDRRVGLSVAAVTLVILVVLFTLYVRAAAKTNQVALAASPKPVSVERSKIGTYRPSRTYVGTLQPWASAKVGPQYVSAYLGTVLVRPGAVVKRGEVLATLDCRNSSAASQAIAARAKALEERRNALAHETERTKQMAEGGFTSENELEQLAARTSAESAEVESLRASLVSKSLEVDDCILRAPFAGEVADRMADPGAYVRPGSFVVTVIDRGTVRVTADAPETDFDVVAPGTDVRIIGTTSTTRLPGKVSRRAPAADEVTRTVHFEIDLPNPSRALPVGTTATLTIDVGQARPAAIVPLRSATVRGEQATLFVVADQIARRKVLLVLGEVGGTLYVDPALGDLPVVVEGRALLDDGDRVAAKESDK